MPHVWKEPDAEGSPKGPASNATSRYVSDPTQVPIGSGIKGAILRETTLASERRLPICGYCRHSDGRGQGHAKGDPRPPFAFKMSMISEFCNSHYLLAACCVFHRRTSRVIHHRELFGFLSSIIPHVQTTRAVRGNTLGNILDILKKKYGSASGPRVPNPRQLP